MSLQDIRYYKGKYPVRIVKRSKGNYLVQALGFCEGGNKEIGYQVIRRGEKFTTVPRLLNLKPRKRDEKR